MEFTIRDARQDDVKKIARLAYLAGKSHMEASVYDLMFPGTKEYRLEVIAELLEKRPWFHHSMFQVAEVSGEVAATLCGYNRLETGIPRLGDALLEIGWSREDARAVIERLEPFLRVYPSHMEDSWLLEHAATAEEYRRQGIMTALLESMLERGRNRGYSRAELALFKGNLPARRAYEKIGFVVAEERTDPRFERTFGCPGMSRMVMELDNPNRGGGGSPRQVPA